MTSNDPLKPEAAGGFARVLSRATNGAVVQLPGRAFPGVVVQGDSLNALISDIERAVADTDPAERGIALRDVMETLQAWRSHYESILDAQGLRRPY